MISKNFITLSAEQIALLEDLPDEEQRALQISFMGLLQAVLSDTEGQENWIHDFCERWYRVKHSTNAYPEVYAECACDNLRTIIETAIDNSWEIVQERIKEEAKIHDISDLL